MKKRLAKITAVGLIAVMAVGLAACGGSNDGGQAAGSAGGEAAAPSSDVEVGIVVKTASNAHFQDISYGAVLAGKDLGINVRVDNTNTEAEVEQQVTKCEDMINAGVDALILTADDSDGVSAAVQAAHDAGIPFITVDTGITNVWDADVAEYLPTFIGVDHEEMAYNLAKNVIDQIGGSGNVVILRGVDAATSSNERTAGFKRAIEESGATLVAENTGKYDQDTAVQVMSDILQTTKDVDAVLCCNDLMAVGAVTALEENGFTVGGDDGVVVAGIDGNLIALQSIKDGKIYGSAYDWSILQGYYAVQQAYAMINGEALDTKGIVQNDDGTYTTITPDTIITAENVDEYLPHGEELDQWSMGSPIETVSDYMRTFIENGMAL